MLLKFDVIGSSEERGEKFLLTPAHKLFLVTFIRRRPVGKIPAHQVVPPSAWIEVLGESPLAVTKKLLKLELLERPRLSDYLATVFSYSQIKELLVAKGITVTSGSKSDLILRLMERVGWSDLWKEILLHHLQEKLDYEGLLAYLRRMSDEELRGLCLDLGYEGLCQLSQDSRKGNRASTISILLKHADYLDLWARVIEGKEDKRHDFSDVKKLLDEHNLSRPLPYSELLGILVKREKIDLLWELVFEFSWLELSSKGVSVVGQYLSELKGLEPSFNTLGIEKRSLVETKTGLPLNQVKVILAFVGGAALEGVIGNRADAALLVLVEQVEAILKSIQVKHMWEESQEAILSSPSSPLSYGSWVPHQVYSPLLSFLFFLVTVWIAAKRFFRRINPLARKDQK